jgi:hypothetical protein
MRLLPFAAFLFAATLAVASLPLAVTAQGGTTRHKKACMKHMKAKGCEARATKRPTKKPRSRVPAAPTKKPSQRPTRFPTLSPTKAPTEAPTPDDCDKERRRC